MPLSYEFTPANVNDTVKLESVLDKALLDYSWLKPTHCIADRGYDSLSNHQAIHKRGIKPIIHIRKAINSTLHGDIYTTIGEPTCMGGNPMEYVRTDSTTGKHLYTCRPEGCHRLQMNLFPPTCRDWHWEDPNDNLRIISVVARASDEWKRMYKKRTVVERTFSSLKRSRLLGQHQYLTQSKIRAHVALSVLTYTATMLSRVLANDVENIRGMRLRV